MKMSLKQKRLVRAINQIAAEIKAGTFTATIRSSAYSISNGKPLTLVGLALVRSGLVTGKQTFTNSIYGLTSALGTTSDALSEEIAGAVAYLAEFEAGRSPSAIKRGAVSRLEALSNALNTTKIRKPYEFTGKFTTAAREYGTFGKEAAPSNFASSASL